MQEVTVFYLVCMLIYLSNSIFCGVVRWFHVCAPYQSDPDYYFPARRQVTIFYLGTLMLLPCVFRIIGSDALLFARCFGVIWYPMVLNFVITAYFGYKEVPKLEMAERCCLMVGIISMAVIAFLDHGIMLEHQKIVLAVSGLFYVYGMVRQLGKLVFLAKEYSSDMREKVSSFDDIKPFFLNSMFPWFVLTEIPLFVAFLLDSAAVQGAVFLWMTFLNTFFLITILHSQKQPRFRIVTADSLDLNNTTESAHSEVLVDHGDSKIIHNEDEIDILLKKIEGIMEKEELFRKQHLTINELAEAVGAHPLSVREACKRNYKNFFDLVNTYRMRFAKDYAAKHPYAKRETVAYESGFGTYRSYLRVESKMGNYESVI